MSRQVPLKFKCHLDTPFEICIYGQPSALQFPFVCFAEDSFANADAVKSAMVLLDKARDNAFFWLQPGMSGHPVYVKDLDITVRFTTTVEYDRGNGNEDIHLYARCIRGRRFELYAT